MVPSLRRNGIFLWSPGNVSICLYFWDKVPKSGLAKWSFKFKWKKQDKHPPRTHTHTPNTVTTALRCWPSCSHSARWLSVADWINVASASVDMGTLQWYFGAVGFCWVSKPGHSQYQAAWPGLVYFFVYIAMCATVYVSVRGGLVLTPRPHG